MSNNPLSEIPGSDSPIEILNMVRNPFEFLERHYREYGPVFRAKIPFDAVFMLGPECNRYIMVSKEREKFSYKDGYGKLAFSAIFERSLLLQDGDEAMHTRSILSPGIGRLAINDSRSRVQDRWNERADLLNDGRSHDCFDTAQQTTFEVSANALMGIEPGPEMEKFREHILTIIAGAMANFKLRFPFGRIDKAIKSREFIIENLKPIILAAREQEPNTLLSLLAQHKEPDGSYLPLEDIANQTLLLFWAGYDTTASAGSWVLHQLAHHQDWQVRIREEVQRELGDADFEVQDQGKLKNLNWFLREIERACPSIIIFPRAAAEDIHYNGYTIPKGTGIIYSPYMTHRMETSFDNPHAFDPDRWNPDSQSPQGQGKNLVGFGGGPRLCIGRNFALMQLRVMITTLVRRFQIEPDPASNWTRQGLPMHRPRDSRVYFRPLS